MQNVLQTLCKKLYVFPGGQPRHRYIYFNDFRIFLTVITDDHSLNESQGTEGNFKIQRRSFYMRLVKKAVSRGEQPEFELVHVVGTLMMQNPGVKSKISKYRLKFLNGTRLNYNRFYPFPRYS